VPRLPGPAPGRRAFGEVDATGTRVSLRVRATTFDAILRIVMTSHAISAAPAMLIARHVAAGRLHAMRVPFDWPELDYGFILRRNRTPSPAALAYMDEVRRIDAALDA
jgi:DNA-binding transcriptional LysR family regulator